MDGSKGSLWREVWFKTDKQRVTCAAELLRPEPCEPLTVIGKTPVLSGNRFQIVGLAGPIVIGRITSFDPRRWTYTHSERPNAEKEVLESNLRPLNDHHM